MSSAHAVSSTAPPSASSPVPAARPALAAVTDQTHQDARQDAPGDQAGAPEQLLLAVRVRPMTATDLPQTTAWQLRYLPHGFFPRLGASFCRAWHGTYLDSSHAVALVAELVGLAEPLPVGYLIGASDQVAHVQHTVTHHRGALARSGAAALLRRPRLAATFVRTRAGAYATRLLRRTTSTGPADGSPVTLDDREQPAQGTGVPEAGKHRIAVVTAVAVTATARGSGVGEALLDAFVARATTAGATRAELVTKADGGAAGFYQRQGWQQIASRVDRNDQQVLTYRLELTDTTRPTAQLPAQPSPQPPSQPSTQPSEQPSTRPSGAAR